MTERICILGGGFGGLTTALELSRQDWGDRPAIDLVDRRERFEFLPLLYDLVTGASRPWEIAPRYADLLVGTGVRHHRAGVTSVDLQARTTTLSDGTRLDWDVLVLALGSEPCRDRVPGAAEHSLGFHSLADARRLGDHLRELEAVCPQFEISVVGAGYSGVELALALADSHGNRAHIRLIEQSDRILPQATDFNRTAALKALARRGVTLLTGTSVTTVEAQALELNEAGSSVRCASQLTLWTVGQQPVGAIADLDLPRDERGRILVETTLQVQGHPQVYALGDLANVIDAQGQPVPATAQSALQAARTVAWNVWARLSDRTLQPFRYRALGEMVSLGKGDAALSGMGLTLSGPLAAAARRLVYISRQPTADQRWRVGVSQLGRLLSGAVAKVKR